MGVDALCSCVHGEAGCNVYIYIYIYITEISTFFLNRNGSRDSIKSSQCRVGWLSPSALLADIPVCLSCNPEGHCSVLSN